MMGMVIMGNLAWHPAAVAWRAVAPTAPSPEAIELLRRRNGTAVYRLVGAGPTGAPIIARLSTLARGLLTRAVYQRILPRLPFRAPRYQAFKAESTRVAWLFLEESHS